MTGRGIDQVLPYPLNPRLYEPYLSDARAYVGLAEHANGPIPRQAGFDYVWGEALPELRRSDVDLRIINLETAITTVETPWPGKEIHYRMHPRNVDCLSVAGIDGCALANNHVLDWRSEGLMETLRTLDATGVKHAGAGKDPEDAAGPALLNVPGKCRVLLFSFASTSSGIPCQWNATSVCPGVNLLADLSETTASLIARKMRQFQHPGDLVVASIHWGGNWGYDIPLEQIEFAHRLIKEGVSIVHGHSSHHVKAIEIFKGRLILYGCGDLLTDYEGISGYESFRGDLALMYLVDLDASSGQLVSVQLIPMHMRRFRLEHVSGADARLLGDLLCHLGGQFGTKARLKEDNRLTLEW
jgi:poly-gamma-glutamate capsule biosynthesis protein CapA/YwtB (metallophosphatase superfamily)